MVEGTGLVDARKLQFLEGVGDLLQMLRGQVQIAGRHLQIFMAEQKLDGAQVGAGFEQMGGPRVANQVRGNSLANAGLLRCFGARQPYRLVGDGLFVVAMQS